MESNDGNEQKTEPESLLNRKWVRVPNEWQQGREKRCWQLVEWIDHSKWLRTWQGESQSSRWVWGTAGRTHTVRTRCWTQALETWPEAVSLISPPYTPPSKGTRKDGYHCQELQLLETKHSAGWGNAPPCEASFPSSAPQYCSLYLDTQTTPLFFFPFHWF